MNDAPSFESRLTAFVTDLLEKSGLDMTVSLEPMPDGLRVNLAGVDAEPLLRRKGEALDALQHVVNAVFREAEGAHQRLVVDCQGFRRAKDRELQQMARFLMDKARATGVPQQIGPLNSYARRLVHLEVTSAPDLSSESVGDGAAKLVIISLKPSAGRT